MYVTAPKPNKEDLPAYYQSQDYISHTDGKRGLFEKTYQFVKRIALSRKQKLIKSYLQEPGRLLDLGCGTGDFLVHAQNNGWVAFGTEPNEQARTLAKNKGLTVASSLDPWTKTFDAITMWHVLEHVYDLEEQIIWLKEHLAQEGKVFVAVPNFESYDAQHYQEFWAAYDVPRHLYHFSQKAIKMLFQDTGLEWQGTHPMKFDAYYVSLLSEKYKSGKMRFLKASRVGWKSNRRARKNGQYSSLVYVFSHKTKKSLI